jgi:hypothetical protein
MCRWTCAAHGGRYEGTAIRGECDKAQSATVTRRKRKAPPLLGDERREEPVNEPNVGETK